MNFDFYKKGLKGNNFMHLFFAIVLIVGMVYVLNPLNAINWDINSPNSSVLRNYSNYSGSMNFSINTSARAVTTILIYYNSSGGANETLFYNMTNKSANQQIFENASVSISGLTDAKGYNFSFYFFNQTNADKVTFRNVTSVNVTIDNTPPNVSSFSGEATSGGNYSTSAHGLIDINVSVSDSTMGMGEVWINITSPNQSMSTFTNASNMVGSVWNISVNISSTYPDGVYTIRVYANDSDAGTLANNNLENITTNLNSSEDINITVDNTAPTASPSCSDAQTGDAFPCSCGGSDATSGTNQSTDSTTSGDGTSAAPSSTGTFTYTCTVTDYAGNTASSTATYTINQQPSSGIAGSSSGTGTSGAGVAVVATAIPPAVFEKITPGVASVQKYTDPNLGLKEIQINVKNEAQNVKVSVTKYSGKPAEVSVEKAGKVFQYMQIKVDNVADKLNKATISTKVKKTWVSDNALTKDKVSLFKFDETAGKWNELSTTYKSEDNTYYYYDAEVTSFSYFAIGENSVVESTAGTGSGTTGGEDTTTGTTTGGTNLTWLWVAIGVIVLAAIAWFVWSKRE